MHPSPDHTQFALIALSVIYVAERLWVLTAKIIAFFDKRANANKKIQVLRARHAPSKARVKLPIAAGGPLPKKGMAQGDGTNRGVTTSLQSGDDEDVSKKRAA